MRVLGDVVCLGRAVPPPCYDRRDLAVEIDARLQDRAAGAELPPCRLRVVAGSDRPLALPVIAEPRRLEDRGRADLGHRPVEVAGGGHLPEPRGRDADGIEEILLRHPVLRHRERLRVRADRNPLRDPRDGLGRNVLEFERHDVHGGRERVERRPVVVSRAGRARGDLGGGGVLLRAVDVAAIAQPGRRQRDHPAELAAAQDADDRTRRQARRRARHVSPPDRRGRPGRRRSGVSASPPAGPPARDRAGRAPTQRAAPR